MTTVWCPVAAVTAAGHRAVPRHGAGIRRMTGTCRAAVLALLAVLGAAAAPGTAWAHATVVLTVNHDGRGSVSVDVGWSDGHPVTESVAATMSAVSAAGTSVGPVPLTRLPGRPKVVYDGVLPSGVWQVSVDTALPGIGHCEAEVRVVAAAGATPGSSRCGGTAAAAPAAGRSTGERAVAATDRPSSNGWPGVLLPALGVAAVLGIGGVVLARRRRRRTATVTRRRPR